MKKGWLALFCCMLGLLCAGCSPDLVTDEVIRLHVVANSDTVEDQALKLQVRDSILEQFSPKWSELSDANACMEVISQQLDEIEAAAAAKLAAAGAQYGVEAAVGIYPFPDRQYGDAFFPAGDYMALKINLGEATGGNWWCLVYPPLCLVGEENEVESSVLSGALAGAKSAGAELPDLEDIPVRVRSWLMEQWEKIKAGDKT